MSIYVDKPSQRLRNFPQPRRWKGMSGLKVLGLWKQEMFIRLFICCGRFIIGFPTVTKFIKHSIFRISSLSNIPFPSIFRNPIEKNPWQFAFQKPALQKRSSTSSAGSSPTGSPFGRSLDILEIHTLIHCM